VGTGACYSVGYYVCDLPTRTLKCNAVAGTPTTETYQAYPYDPCTDGVDNDCDGSTDEC
jgi:hypothetical protein